MLATKGECARTPAGGLFGGAHLAAPQKKGAVDKARLAVRRAVGPQLGRRVILLAHQVGTSFPFLFYSFLLLKFKFGSNYTFGYVLGLHI